MTKTAVTDLLAVEVPLGGRVLVISDLHLGAVATATSTAATTELARAIEAWTGPGLVVFNGSCLELLCPSPCPGACEPKAALAVHARLARVVLAFSAAPGRRVVYLPGARDGRAAWDPAVAASLHQLLGAEIALALDLTIDTGAGPCTVRVEPGHQLDPLTHVNDPRNSAESPLGHHLLTEVIPALRESTAAPSKRQSVDGWLSGLESLDDPASFPRFLASRLTYRRLGRHTWVLGLPLLAAVLLRLPFAAVRHAHEQVASATRVAVFLALATVVGLLLVGTVVALLVRGTWRALGGWRWHGESGGAPAPVPGAIPTGRPGLRPGRWSPRGGRG